jgi:hypothetical protein
MLDAIHAAIIARLSADITGLQTCAAYPKLQRKVSIPAVLLELDGLEEDDFGDGTADFTARFTAYCIISPNDTDADMSVRNLAATVAVRVSQEADFNVDAVQRSAEILRVGEDSFKPELDSYLVWAVEFQLGITLGETVWSATPATGVSVATITVGSLNNVGIAHSMAAGGDEPAADDLVPLPETPKG